MNSTNLTGTVFSNPLKQLCFKLYYECRNSLESQENIWETKCGHDYIRQCTRTPSNNELPTGLLVIFVLIAIFSFMANGFVCVVYMLSKEIRTAKHYFIVNLATADVLIAALAIPFYLTQYIPNSSKTLCQVGSMVDVLCCTSSIVGFSVISVERFVAVKYPLRYQTIVSRKRCLLVLSLAWGYSIAFSLASQIPSGTLYMDHCVFFTNTYLYATTFASFLFPLLAALLAYGWIYKVAKYQAQQINDRIPRTLNRMKREFKAAKTLTRIIGTFVLCWLPFFCYIWIFSLYKVEVPYYELYYIVQIVRFSNSLANPFIYVGINREFRRSTFKMLKRCLLSIEHRTSDTNEGRQTTDVVLRNISAASLDTSL